MVNFFSNSGGNLHYKSFSQTKHIQCSNFHPVKNVSIKQLHSSLFPIPLFGAAGCGVELKFFIYIHVLVLKAVILIESVPDSPIISNMDSCSVVLASSV